MLRRAVALHTLSLRCRRKPAQPANSERVACWTYPEGRQLRCFVRSSAPGMGLRSSYHGRRRKPEELQQLGSSSIHRSPLAVFSATRGRDPRRPQRLRGRTARSGARARLARLRCNGAPGPRPRAFGSGELSQLSHRRSLLGCADAPHRCRPSPTSRARSAARRPGASPLPNRAPERRRATRGRASHSYLAARRRAAASAAAGTTASPRAVAAALVVATSERLPTATRGNAAKSDTATRLRIQRLVPLAF